MSSAKSARLIRGAILCALLALACSDSTKPYESIGGLWVGTAADAQDTTDIEFQIVDRGGPLEGVMSLGPGSFSYPFVGTHEGSGMQLAIAVTHTDSAYVNATINGDQMAGTFSYQAASAKLSLWRQ